LAAARSSATPPTSICSIASCSVAPARDRRLERVEVHHDVEIVGMWCCSASPR